MHPVLFETDFFGILSEPFAFHTYGLFILSGFLLAAQLAKKQGEREGEDPERLVDLAISSLLSGLIGARIVFAFTKLDEFSQDPLQIFMFWKGGLVWYGGFIGAVFYLWFTLRKHKLNTFKILDLFIPYTALAHAFGRLGCLAAGCCFGKVCSLPWGIVFPSGSMAHQQQHRDGLIRFAEQAHAVHPTQLYEAGAEFALFWLLIALRPHKRFHGQLFLTWISIYPILRSVIEMFRGDKERGVYILSTSQYISIAVGLAAIGFFVYLRKQRVELSAA